MGGSAFCHRYSFWAELNLVVIAVFLTTELAIYWLLSWQLTEKNTTGARVEKGKVVQDRAEYDAIGSTFLNHSYLCKTPMSVQFPPQQQFFLHSLFCCIISKYLNFVISATHLVLITVDFISLFFLELLLISLLVSDWINYNCYIDFKFFLSAIYQQYLFYLLLPLTEGTLWMNQN